ncbi:MAG: hypothetical protein SGPRY_007841, partial [Prymnesium sp.]
QWWFPSDVEFRSYQHAMARSALLENTLVSLPTGLGKTLIASVVLYNHWKWFPSCVVIFMAPTRPLVSQQLGACCKMVGWCAQRDARLITGADPPALRRALWAGQTDGVDSNGERRRIFFCTPQTLSNDLESEIFDGRSVCCLVVDEAHHAASPNYGYARVVHYLRRVNPWFRLLALSATAGADLPAVQRVVDTLGISRIETRDEQVWLALSTPAYVKVTPTLDVRLTFSASHIRGPPSATPLADHPTPPFQDEELRQHIHSRLVRIVDVAEPDSQRREASVRGLILQAGSSPAARLHRAGFLFQGEVCRLREEDVHAGLNRLSHAETSSSLAKGGGILGGYTHEELHGFTRDLRQLRALVTLASTVQRWSDDGERAPGETSHADIDPESGVRRARDGAELGRQAQGLLSEAESAGLDRERSNELRTLLTALSDEPSAVAGAQRGEWQRIAPKLHRLCSLLSSFFEETPHSRAIAFVKRRSTVGALCAQLDVNPLTSKCVRAAAFVGQSARHDLGLSTAATGMDQAQQRQVLSDFSSGRFNVLVATSVAEEGLDVGECDLCICFDTVSSPIRLIQRFGRTGRKREGQCVLLLTSSEKQLYLDTMRRAQQLAAAVESGRGIELKRRAPSILAADIVAALVCRFYSTKETRQVCSSTAARKVDAGAIEKRNRSICSTLKENQEPQFWVRPANREMVSRGGKRPLLHNHMQRERATPSSQVDLLSLCYSSDENEMDKPKAQRTPGSPVDNGEIHEKALSPHGDAQSAGHFDGNAPVQLMAP